MGTKQHGFTHIVLLVVLIFVVGVGYIAYSRVLSQNQPVLLPENSVEKVTKQSEKKFSFTAAGDFKNEANADAVLSAIGAAKSDFTLALGDFSYAGNGSEPAWCDFVSERVGENHPFQLIAGNHDDGESEGDIAEYVKCLPNKLPNIVGDYGIEYYFDYKNLARFILISPDIDNYGFDYIDGNEHLQWVVNAVKDARAQGVEWVVLGMHKNCITAGEKTCEIGDDLLNTAVNLKIDIVLQGHEHAYFRSKQLALNPDTCPAIVVNEFNQSCIAASSNEMEKGAGTVIVISGAGGYQLRDVSLQDPEYDYFAAFNGANVGNSYGFSSFIVKKDTINASFVPAVGTFKDSFTLTAR
jgi:Calcineurin-like phosphoesterase